MGGEGADTFVFTGKFMDAGDVDYIKDFSVSQSDSFDFSGCWSSASRSRTWRPRSSVISRWIIRLG
jgi:Ca2+-binding RTX toxin-like protein